MARRIFKTKVKPINTTIHPDLYNLISKFRMDYMKINGKYLNNSAATQLLAKKMSRVKPPRFGDRRKIGI